MEVRLYGAPAEDVVDGNRNERDRWSHPLLPGLRISAGLQPTKNGPQPFVTLSTEDMRGHHDDNGTPVMAIYLNDATLHDVEPEPEPRRFETTVVITHYARSDEEARQLSHDVGDWLFEHAHVVRVEGSTGDEPGKTIEPPVLRWNVPAARRA